MWLPDAPSDHQDHYIFRIGDSELNLHLPLLMGKGPHPRYKIFWEMGDFELGFAKFFIPIWLFVGIVFIPFKLSIQLIEIISN